MKALLLLTAAGLAAGIAWLLRPRPRCAICNAEVTTDPTDAAPIGGWHWGPPGDA